MQPDTQLPWPTAFRTQKTLPGLAVGTETPSASESAGDVLPQRLAGGGGSRREADLWVQAMHLHLGMARKLFLSYPHNKENLKEHITP